MANKKGRPKTQPQSPQQLRQLARESIRRTQERQLGRASLDVKEVCEKVDDITLKHKYSREEMDLLRRQVDLLYHEYVLDKWQEEAEHMEPHSNALQAIAIDYGERSTSKQMTEAEWRELHGLRKDGKGLKPGPSKRKPKSAFDMELVPGEPIDFEELELQWMEEQILRKKNEPHQLKGKRMRGDAVNAVTPRAEDKLFWY